MAKKSTISLKADEQTAGIVKLAAKMTGSTVSAVMERWANEHIAWVDGHNAAETIYTNREVAKALGVSPRTVTRYLALFEVPVLNRGTPRQRVPASSLAFLKQKLKER